jgi:hypothetical protein
VDVGYGSEVDGDETQRFASLRAQALDARLTAAALRARNQETCRRAKELVARARCTIQSSIAVCESAFITRCAWCGRSRIGDEWSIGDPPRLSAQHRITHGVCDDCVAGLRDEGKSV